MKKLLIIKNCDGPTVFANYLSRLESKFFLHDWNRLEIIQRIVCAIDHQKRIINKKVIHDSRFTSQKKKVAGPSQAAKPSQKPYGKNFKF
jgi:hypothetical protein